MYQETNNYDTTMYNISLMDVAENVRFITSYFIYSKLLMLVFSS